MYASRSLTGTHVFYSSLVYVTLLVSGCLGLKASSETSILPPYLVRASKAMFGVINRRARLYWRRRGGNDPPDSWPTHPSKRIPLPWHLRFHSFRPRENSLFIRSRLHLFVPHFSYIAGLSEAQLFINNLGESIIYIWKTRLGEQGKSLNLRSSPLFYCPALEEAVSRVLFLFNKIGQGFLYKHFRKEGWEPYWH